MKCTKRIVLLLFIIILVGCTEEKDPVPQTAIVGSIDNFPIIEEKIAADESGHIVCEVWESIPYHQTENYFYTYDNPCQTKQVIHYVVKDTEKIEFTFYVENYNPVMDSIINSGVVSKKVKDYIIEFFEGDPIVRSSIIDETSSWVCENWSSYQIYSDDYYVYSYNNPCMREDGTQEFIIIGDTKIRFDSYIAANDDKIEEIIKLSIIKKTPAPRLINTLENYKIYEEKIGPNESGNIVCETWEYIEYYDDDNYIYVYENPCLSDKLLHYVWDLEDEYIEFTEFMEKYNPLLEEVLPFNLLVKKDKD